MSTIIFDLDHTLLETSKIARLITDIFLKNGVPEKTVETIQKTQRAKNHDNPDFLDQINEVEKLGYKISKKDIENFFEQNLECYLKDSAKETLEKLINNGNKLLLFTKGVEYFQKFKIRQSGLEKYFDGDIYIFENNKEETDVDIHKNGKVYFVNDNADEIEIFSKIHPKVKFIYVTGTKTSHNNFSENKNIVKIENISSLLKYIK